MSKFRPARVFIKAGQTDVEVGEYEGRVGSCINPVFQKLLNSALLCPRNVLKMSPFLKLFAQILQIPFSKGLCPVPSKFVPFRSKYSPIRTDYIVERLLIDQRLSHTNHEFNTPMKCYNKQEFSSHIELNSTSQNHKNRQNVIWMGFLNK